MGSKWFWGILFAVVSAVLLAGTLYVRTIAPGTKLSRPSSISTTAPVPSENPLPLTLTIPKDDLLVRSENVRIAGTSEPAALIAITGGLEPVIVEVDEAGVFATEISIFPGLNTITITAFRTDGTETSITRNVIYDDTEATS